MKRSWYPVVSRGRRPACRQRQGFGAFSIGKSQVSIVVNYIQEQPEHHRKISFREEYLEFLKENDIEFDERYILKPVE
jgi:hypothetical protein